MKSRYLKSVILSMASIGLVAGSVNASVISVFEASDTASINAWYSAQNSSNSGNIPFVIEDFDDEDTGWYESYTTTIDIDGVSYEVGTFAATGSAGEGDSSYRKIVDPNDTDTAYFEISDDKFPTSHGRGDLTGGNYLDSADVSEIEFNLNENVHLTNLFFYMMDPLDAGASVTTVTANGEVSYDIADLIPTGDSQFPNATLWFVGISGDDTDIINQVRWSTDNHTNDGWGIDKIGTVVTGREPYGHTPVPEPGTLLLLGAGIAGLAGIRRIRK